MNQRQLSIVQDLANNEELSVIWLAEKYNVSNVTIRNDLRQLENQGLLKRTHGGATAPSNEMIDYRLAFNYAIKERIASEAAKLVVPGETVMIESGSTNALLAKKLAEKKDVTIVTNSCFIASYVRDLSGIHVVLLGGDYQKQSEVCVGPLTRIALQAFFVDKLFFGTDSYSEEFGFSSVNLSRAEALSAMAERAHKRILLTDSSKFDSTSKMAVVGGLKLADTSMLITDDGISAKDKEIFERNGIELRIVSTKM